MTSTANIKNISSLPKEMSKQVASPDKPSTQDFDGFTIVKQKDSIKKIYLQDFPTPGSVVLTKSQGKVIDSSNKNSCSRNIFNAPLVTDPRTIAFEHMADKTRIAKSLKCTKACSNIKKDTNTGEFGVCYRAYCTFAHSMAELQPALCNFDSNCRFKHGKILDWNSRTIEQGSKCKFRHSDEDIQEYYSRSGMKRPDLPLTSDHTRKIPPVKEVSSTHEIKYSPKASTKEEVKKIKYSQNAPTKEEVKASTKEEVKDQRKTYESEEEESEESESEESESEESEESSDSESEDSESEEDRRLRLKKERKQRKQRKSKKSPKPDIQVIRVPTNELAEIALKAAFDRGQFNVQIIIE
jgi:chemotaxis protein histidine kinase CheA